MNLVMNIILIFIFLLLYTRYKLIVAFPQMWSYMADFALNNGIANPQAASCFLRLNVITVVTWSVYRSVAT